jgi:DNA sulfur modification protein DndC
MTRILNPAFEFRMRFLKFNTYQQKQLMRNDLNLFGIGKMSVDEAIGLTIASLTEYANRHRHWAIAWSGGKDSTTIATLTLQLISTGQIPKPESLTVFFADTRMELTPLWISAQVLMGQMRERGVTVQVVMAPLDKRFLVYILGRGVPPPSNTFRWCTGHIKVQPMHDALQLLHAQLGAKILMITGVRQGESAVRDGRISMSCSKDGSECGQGWYQTGLPTDICSTLAPILHWRVCLVWDWLKVYAPSAKYGAWHTTMVADAYGGDEAEEINARTGCIGCPLASKDKALDTIIKMPYWSYLAPLKGLKVIYREMRKPAYRLRKPGGEARKDGSLSKNQQRMGPLTLQARTDFFHQILTIQTHVNEAARRLGKPEIDILNEMEQMRIIQLISASTWPDGWSGTEPTADLVKDAVYADGSVMPWIFREMITS